MKIYTTQDFLNSTPKNEDQFSANTHKWINHNYPQLRGKYFHVANESATSPLMRIKLASMGVLPGVLDYCFLPINIGAINTPLWFLELKYGQNGMSGKQKAFADTLDLLGILWGIAWNAHSVVERVQKIYGY